MVSQKGFGIIYILVGILILAGLVGGAFYLGQKTSKTSQDQTSITQPTFQPSATSDEMANWKTYENPTYKYSLRIPSNWVIDFDNAKKNNNRLVFIYSEDFKVVGDTQVPHLSSGSQLEILSDIVAESYNNFITFSGPVKSEYPNEGEELIIDEEKAMMWTSNNAYSIPEQKGYQLNVFHNGKGYQISMLSSSSQEQLFNQILSTFKFLDKKENNEIANWKTYTNKYLTFKYPASWNLDSTDNASLSLSTIRSITDKASGDYTPGMGWLNFYISNDPVQKVIDLTSGEEKTGQSNINGNSYTRLTGHSGVGGSVYFVNIIMNSNGKTYVVSLSTQDSNLEELLTSELDQILSTFKFQ